MKTANELNRPHPELALATRATAAPDRTPRYRPRELGVGYGKSSGYARATSFVTFRGDQAIRCR